LAEAADTDALFAWAEEAARLAGGPGYKGRSSPWWYSAGPFWELLQAAGQVPVERLVETLEGGSDRERCPAVAVNRLGRPCKELAGAQAAALLGVDGESSKEVAPDRLGRIGRRDDFCGYAKETGTFERDGARVPFVVEVWANRAPRPRVTVAVNRTPV